MITAGDEPRARGFGGREDEVYQALIDAHRGLPDVDSAALNARLVFLLAHALGDAEHVLALIQDARGTVSPAD